MTKYKPSGRGKAVLALDWSPESLPDGTVIEPHTLIASDGEVSRATLYTLGSPTAVVCLMHPRQDMQRHPLIPELLERGYGVWAHASRVVGNDLTLVHEHVLLDVAAGMEILRDRGFEHVTLCGVSGGAGLYSFYTEQALADEKIERTPGGAPSGLGEAPMPAPDALALIAPHPGQGRLLLAMIDPSVTDEADPFSVDPGLDPYNPENGFDAEGSSYSQEWLSAYREAQRARVKRIDDHARELIATQRAAKKDGDLRRGTLTPVITTYRTDADPRCTDLSLDANDRKFGSVISPKPQISNYGLGGFGRLTNAESWLSTWSGLSSNGSVERSLAGVTVPTLIIEYTGDQSVFPSDIKAALSASAAEDPQHVAIKSNHFAKRLSRDDEDPIPQTADALVGWIKP
jgi:hypothetical protein